MYKPLQIRCTKFLKNIIPKMMWRILDDRLCRCPAREATWVFNRAFSAPLIQFFTLSKTKPQYVLGHGNFHPYLLHLLRLKNKHCFLRSSSKDASITNCYVTLWRHWNGYTSYLSAKGQQLLTHAVFGKHPSWPCSASQYNCDAYNARNKMIINDNWKCCRAFVPSYMCLPLCLS